MFFRASAVARCVGDESVTRCSVELFCCTTAGVALVVVVCAGANGDTSAVGACVENVWQCGRRA